MAPSFPSATPPMASTDRRGSYDSYDIDCYFSKTYVPLSNLPTPPPSSHSSSSSRGHIPVLDLDGDVDPNLLGPAFYLKNLIPSAASLIDPDIHIIYSILASADIPLPTIALAVCILDSLNSRFALSWRRSFPLRTSGSHMSQELHIDSIRPEVIILAALIISVKFLDDRQSTTGWYSKDWGSGKWTCEQINATQKCIMENLGYRLLPLWTEEMIGDALDEMERAGRFASRLVGKNTHQKPELDLKAVISSKAVWSAEMQIMTTETPKSENIRGTQDFGPLAKPTFGFDHDSMNQDLALTRTVAEISPTYTEPVLEF